MPLSAKATVYNPLAIQNPHKFVAGKKEAFAIVYQFAIGNAPMTPDVSTTFRLLFRQLFLSKPYIAPDLPCLHPTKPPGSFPLKIALKPGGGATLVLPMPKELSGRCNWRQRKIIQ